jgi:hypothetical protein
MAPANNNNSHKQVGVVMAAVTFTEDAALGSFSAFPTCAHGHLSSLWPIHWLASLTHFSLNIPLQYTLLLPPSQHLVKVHFFHLPQYLATVLFFLPLSSTTVAHSRPFRRPIPPLWPVPSFPFCNNASGCI